MKRMSSYYRMVWVGMPVRRPSSHARISVLAPASSQQQHVTQGQGDAKGAPIGRRVLGRGSPGDRPSAGSQPKESVRPLVDDQPQAQARQQAGAQRSHPSRDQESGRETTGEAQPSVEPEPDSLGSLLVELLTADPRPAVPPPSRRPALPGAPSPAAAMPRSAVPGTQWCTLSISLLARYPAPIPNSASFVRLRFIRTPDRKATAEPRPRSPRPPPPASPLRAVIASSQPLPFLAERPPHRLSRR